MKRNAVVFVAALVVAAWAYADKTDPEPKKKAPPKASIRGKVSSVTLLRARGLVGAISVDGKKEKDTEYDRARVTLTDKTKFYKWVDGKKQEAKFADITKDSIVQCDFTGPVAESYPVQARASEVLILEIAKKK